MAGETIYVVDGAHRIRRECGNCALAEWTERRDGFRCQWNRRWRTLGVSEPCGAWRIEEDAWIWDGEKRKWLK